MLETDMLQKTREKLCSLEPEYYCLNPAMPKVPHIIVPTNNMHQTYVSIRPQKTLLDETVNTLEEYNGLMVLPHDIDANIDLLFNQQKIIKYTLDGSYTWYGTFAHELTHAIDFYQMARMEKLKNYEPLDNADDYRLFYLWSEYHARRLGYRFLRNKLKVDVFAKSQEAIENIKTIEWPTRVIVHYNIFHTANNAVAQMEITMHLLGRYSVWCDIYPMAFDLHGLKATFGSMPWVCELFSFLNQHATLAEVYPRFADLRAILVKNWNNL